MQRRQGRNNDRFNNDSRNNNRRNENQAPAPREDSHENINVNDIQSHEPRVESNRGNNNNRVGNRRNENNSRRIETPAKIVRDIDMTHDATYDEDDRYRAERESYYENDGNGRIVDHQIETIDDRHRVSATESDRERGRETIINRYEGEDKHGNKKNDERGITVVINNNIPIENNVDVNVKAENNNEINNANKNNIYARDKKESKPLKRWQKGDVNRNGILDENDIELVKKMVIGELKYDELADWDNNGHITVTDLAGEKQQVDKAVKERENKNPKKLWGDINHDGVINQIDEDIALDIYTSEDKNFSKYPDADIDGNGIFNYKDFSLVSMLVKGLTTQENVEEVRRKTLEEMKNEEEIKTVSLNHLAEANYNV